MNKNRKYVIVFSTKCVYSRSHTFLKTKWDLNNLIGYKRANEHNTKYRSSITLQKSQVEQNTFTFQATAYFQDKVWRYIIASGLTSRQWHDVIKIIG